MLSSLQKSPLNSNPSKSFYLSSSDNNIRLCLKNIDANVAGLKIGFIEVF